MRIFVTGATGYLGSAVFDALVHDGHHVDALVRTRDKAAAVQARGGHAVVGDISKPESWGDAAGLADGVVHAAIEYGPRAEATDAAALDAVLPRLAPGRFLLYTSGVWVLGSTTTAAAEEAALDPVEYVAWRPAHEARVLEAEAAGIRPIVVRPGILYGGSRGIVGDLFKDAANGLLRVIGPGDNHWALVYDRDLADLYVRLVTSPEASGIYHANDEADESVNEIVAAIAAHARINPGVRHVPMDEARKKMGSYADALALDQIVRSPRARALGWAPTLHSVCGNTARLFEEWRRGGEAA